MKKSLKTEALVLKKKYLLGKNLLLTLFTQNYGKITVLAYGIKNIKSRRLSHIETSNLIIALIEKKAGRYYLKETQLISAFSLIKKEALKLKFLYFFLFILDRILPENQKEEKAYLITKKFLIDLSCDDNFNSNKFFKYQNKILMILGYLQKKLKEKNLSLFIEELIDEKIPPFLKV